MLIIVRLKFKIIFTEVKEVGRVPDMVIACWTTFYVRSKTFVMVIYKIWHITGLLKFVVSVLNHITYSYQLPSSTGKPYNSNIVFKQQPLI